MNRLDHIVLAAASLEQGVDYLRERLGVDIPKGGFHRTMGTHNHLMQLGSEAYLELIAIDPAAPAPAFPRWFDLDQALLRAELERQPRLITWVVNTPDIGGLAAAAGFDVGVPTALSRDDLRWEIALPDDGRLLADGLLPYCIQWHSSPHPSLAMADLGCRLESLQVYHNRPQWIAARLQALGAGHLVEVIEIPDSEAPALGATIRTADRGSVSLSSRIPRK